MCVALRVLVEEVEAALIAGSLDCSGQGRRGDLGGYREWSIENGRSTGGVAK